MLFELSNGRRLGYVLYGDPHGFPVLNCHGGLLCRLDAEPAARVARELGVLLISPDRPGVGISQRWPGHDTLDWTLDVTELLDHLGVDRFAVTGWSLGGQYCAAVAHSFGSRVTRAAIVAGCPPLDGPARRAELDFTDRALCVLSSRAPLAARAVLALARTAATRFPVHFTWNVARSAGRRDRAALVGNTDWLCRALVEGLRDTAGVVDEYEAMVAPWRFDLGEIEAFVDLWQGDDDRSVPSRWAHELASRIPHCRLQMLAGEGHMIGITRRHEVLSRLLEPTTPGGAH